MSHPGRLTERRKKVRTATLVADGATFNILKLVFENNYFKNEIKTKTGRKYFWQAKFFNFFFEFSI